ncbi:MAG: hypothetical protein AB7O26_15485, partial [Planctomycetaceae bacterium]
REAARLEVDGCWWLLHFFEGRTPFRDEGAVAAEATMIQSISRVHYDDMLNAAVSLIEQSIGAEIAPLQLPETSGHSGGNPSESTSPTSPPEVSPGNSSSLGFLGGDELAAALGIHPSRQTAFFKQLERKRMVLGDNSWHEVSEPQSNSPRFHYRVDSAGIVQLATKYRSPKDE